MAERILRIASTLLLRCVVVGMLVGWTGTVSADSQSPEITTVSSYVDALNRRDMKRLRELVSPSFVIADPEMKCAASLTPRECHLRMLQATAIRNREQRTITAVRQELDVIRANITIESTALKRAGIDRILITEEFVVDGDTIRSSRVTLRTEDPQTKQYQTSLRNRR